MNQEISYPGSSREGWLLGAFQRRINDLRFPFKVSNLHGFSVWQWLTYWFYSKMWFSTWFPWLPIKEERNGTCSKNEWFYFQLTVDNHRSWCKMETIETNERENSMSKSKVIHTGTLSERAFFSNSGSVHPVKWFEVDEARNLIDGNICQYTRVNGKQELETLWISTISKR